MNKLISSLLFLILANSCDSLKKEHMMSEPEEGFHLIYVDIYAKNKDTVLICTSAHDLYYMLNIKFVDFNVFCDELCEYDKNCKPLLLSDELYDDLGCGIVFESKKVDSIYTHLNLTDVYNMLNNNELSLTETRYLGSLLWKDNILLSHYLGERKWYIDK